MNQNQFTGRKVSYFFFLGISCALICFESQLLINTFGVRQKPLKLYLKINEVLFLDLKFII